MTLHLIFGVAWLMRLSERKSADHEKRTAHALKEIEFLLMVDDEGRQGALSFKK